MSKKKDLTAVEKQIQNSNVQTYQQDHSSDLIKAMEILHAPTNLESNTILTNEQVNALTLMHWGGQVYDIDFFKYYVPLFCKYRISGDDGRGRKEIIQIAEAIRKEKEAEHNRMLEIFGRR